MIFISEIQTLIIIRVLIRRFLLFFSKVQESILFSNIKKKKNRVIKIEYGNQGTSKLIN